MRILFLNSEAELHNNGGDKVLLMTVETLAAHHEVEVLLPVPGPLVDAIRDLGVRCDVSSYPIVRRNTARPLAAARYFAGLVASTFRLWRHVRRREVDVVYANSLGVVQGAVLRLLSRRRRHIWHIHDMIDRPRVVNRVYSRLIAYGADIAVCVSEAARHHLPFRRDNLRVVWNGIPPVVPEPQFAATGDPPVVGVIGRFNKTKGHVEVVRAAAILRDNAASFRVRLVGGTYGGDTSELIEVKRLVTELELGDMVSVEGPVTDVGAVYQGLDVVVVPSLLLDSFPTVALEAMSAGKPVVGYDSGGLREMLDGDTDCVVPSGDVDRLATLLQRMLEDEAWRQATARRQYSRYLEHFTLSEYQDRLWTALGGVLGAEPSGHHTEVGQ
ncbi:MAG: glycosyltransferase family 4 protein [bacterium]|nr:glycosyltransferase family 4 protein [bacterium]